MNIVAGGLVPPDAASRENVKPTRDPRGPSMPRLRPLAACAVLAALLALPAGANHVPPTATVAEVPGVDGDPEWVCFGGLFWPERLQVGDSCRFWCITDGGCAVFYTDVDYLDHYPFSIEFVNAENQVVRRHSSELEDHVCMYWYEMLDLHFTWIPDRVGPGTVGHVFAVKDEGQFCPFPYSDA